MDGAAVLDLFAGIGTMGLEALSRGASLAVMVDSDERCVAAIQANVDRLRFTDRTIVLRDDALTLRLTSPAVFSLVFVDPPYAMYDDPDSSKRLEAAVAGLPVAGLILVEHRTTQSFDDAWAGGKLTDRRKYGGTTLSIYRR